MFEQFLFGREVAPLQVARVVNEYVGVAGLFPDPCERIRYGVTGREVQLDDHALAPLFVDCCLQRDGVGGGTSGQHCEEALFCEFLGDGSADAPAHAHGQVAVVE